MIEMFLVHCSKFTRNTNADARRRWPITNQMAVFQCDCTRFNPNTYSSFATIQNHIFYCVITSETAEEIFRFFGSKNGVIMWHWSFNVELGGFIRVHTGDSLQNSTWAKWIHPFGTVLADWHIDVVAGLTLFQTILQNVEFLLKM